MGNKSFGSMSIVLIIALGSFISGSSAYASEFACSTLASHISIFEQESKLYFRIDISNPGSLAVELKKNTLYESSFELEAEDSSGETLEHVLPLIALGTTPLILEPGETRTVSIDLYASFPTLQDTRASKEVILTWNFELAPKGVACLSQTAGTARLGPNR